VNGFVIDEEWAIRCIEVATRNWLPGKKVPVSPEWIERVSWTDSEVRVALSLGSHQNGSGIPHVQADYSRLRRPLPFALRSDALLATQSRAELVLCTDRQVLAACDPTEADLPA
jgi:hypothetical protein